MAKTPQDVADLVVLLADSGSAFLRTPTEEALEQALFNDGIVLIHEVQSGRVRAGAVLYDWGMLQTGARLFEFGSVDVEPPLRGFGLMPTLAAALILPREIYDSSPEDYASEVMAVVALEPEPNVPSLKQMPRCGFSPFPRQSARHILALRDVAEGRQIFLYDRSRSCELARRLLNVALAKTIPHSKDLSRALSIDVQLSLVTDGVMENFIELQCPAVAA